MNLMPPSLNEAQFSQMVFRLVTLLVSLKYDYLPLLWAFFLNSDAI